MIQLHRLSLIHDSVLDISFYLFYYFILMLIQLYIQTNIMIKNISILHKKKSLSPSASELEEIFMLQTNYRIRYITKIEK